MGKDVEVPAEEPIAALEPPEAFVVAPAGKDEEVPEDEPTAAPEAAVGVGFYLPNATIIEGQWGGLPNYQCSACGFDSLDQAKTETHLSIHGQTFTE